VELTVRARVGIYCARGEGEFTIGITGARSQELALASALPCPEKITNSGSQKSVPEIQPNPPPLSCPPQYGSTNGITGAKI